MDVQKAFDEFLIARIAEGRAQRTLEDYHRVVEPFVEWCHEQGLADVRNLTPHNVREYVGLLRSRGWAPATVSIYVRVLRSMWRWWYEEGFTEINLAKAVRHTKVKSKPPDLPDFDEMRKLLSVCSSDTFLGARDRAIITMFVDTGVRVGELVRLRLSDVHLNGDSGFIHVYAPKTDTARFAFTEKVASRALKRYLEKRQARKNIKEEAKDILFVTKYGEPMAPNTVQRMIKRRAQQAGLDPRKIHPHLLRKMFATVWVENGGDETHLQTLAGWQSSEMVSIYVLSAKRRQLQRAHQRYSPADAVFLENYRYDVDTAHPSDDLVLKILRRVVDEHGEDHLYSLVSRLKHPEDRSSSEASDQHQYKSKG